MHDVRCGQDSLRRVLKHVDNKNKMTATRTYEVAPRYFRQEKNRQYTFLFLVVLSHAT